MGDFYQFLTPDDIKDLSQRRPRYSKGLWTMSCILLTTLRGFFGREYSKLWLI